MSFENSSIVITGGNKGIGLEIARFFARNTKRPIVLIARNADELKEAKNLCLKDGAEKVDTLAVDLIKHRELEEIDFSLYNPGLLVNNAGSFLFKKLKQTSAEEFTSQFQINALGGFNLTKAVLPELEKKDRALIVNIASMSALKGSAGSGAYAMSKHATLGFTRSLRKELKKTNIAVTAINLGQTYSTSWKDVDIDQNKLIDPEDVARLIYALSQLSPRTVAEEINLMPQGGEVSPN